MKNKKLSTLEYVLMPLLNEKDEKYVKDIIRNHMSEVKELIRTKKIKFKDIYEFINWFFNLTEEELEK